MNMMLGFARLILKVSVVDKPIENYSTYNKLGQVRNFHSYRTITYLKKKRKEKKRKEKKRKEKKRKEKKRKEKKRKEKKRKEKKRKEQLSKILSCLRFLNR